MTTTVITHQYTDGHRISVCSQHDAPSYSPRGGQYGGVHFGAHQGECDICPRTSHLLDRLLDSLRSGRIGPREYNEWTSLPTFGGEEPTDTQGVWSWDESRLLVGTCAEDLQIVPREGR